MHNFHISHSENEGQMSAFCNTSTAAYFDRFSIIKNTFYKNALGLFY